MSHIDSFKHQIVGVFVCIPVYRPLVTIDGDFYCDENQLVLGGGSGEHPALVLKDPEAAAAWFLYEEIPGLNISEEEKTEWREKVSRYVNRNVDDILEFYDWLEMDHRRFYELCTSDKVSSTYFGNERSFEEWLVLGFGEFVYYAMPHLAPNVVATSEAPYAPFLHTEYNNILLIPPNFPVYSNGGNAFKSELVNKA